MIRRHGKNALVSLVAVLLLTWTVTAGAQTVTGIMHAMLNEPNQKTTEISTAELLKILDERSALLIDSRPYSEYAVSHIPGALTAAQRPGVSQSAYTSAEAEVGRLVGGDKAAPIVLYCNGLHCPASKVMAERLVAAGFTNVRRYQLGLPVWRGLGGVTATELHGVLYVHGGDQTAVFLDARSHEEFKVGTLARAKNLPLAEVRQALADGRLPTGDRSTRIIVFGKDSAQARQVAEAIVRMAFWNTSYFVGTYDALKSVIK